MNQENQDGQESIRKETTAAETAGGSKKKTYIIIGSLAAVFVVALIGLILSLTLFKSDKQKVMEGFENLNAELSDESIPGLFHYLGIVPKTADEALLTEDVSYQSEFNMAIEELPASLAADEQITELAESMGIQVISQYDKENKALSAKLNATLGTMASMGIRIAMDEEYVYIELPDLLEGSIGFEVNNLKENFENSPLGEYSDWPLSDDFTLNVFDEQENSVLSIVDQFQTGLMDASKSAAEGMEVTKTDNKESFTLGDATVEGTEYLVTFPKESYIAACQVVRDYYADIFTYTYGTMLDEYGGADELFAELDSYIAGIDEDLAIYLWMTKKNQVTKISYPFSAEVGEDTEELIFNVILSGQERLTDAVVFQMIGQEGQEINLNFDRKVSGTKADRSLTLEAPEAPEISPIFTSNYSFDSADGSFRLELTLEDPDLPMSFVAAGNAADVVKGKAYTINLDELSMSSADETFVFSGSYSYGPLEGPIEIPETLSYNLFEMTEDDLNEVFYEVYTNAVEQYSFE